MATWHRWETDWEGPLEIELDRSYGEGYPFAHHLPDTHPTLLQVRLSRPADREIARAELDRFTALILETLSGTDFIHVGLTHRPDRSVWTMYLPSKHTQAGQKKAQSLAELDLSPLTFLDVHCAEDPDWSFYTSVLLPKVEDWSLNFRTQEQAEAARRELAALGAEVSEVYESEAGGFDLLAKADAETLFHDDVHAIVDSHEGEITGHGSTM
jgi:hypothetical protein